MLLTASASAHPDRDPGKGHPATTDGKPVTLHIHRAHVLYRSAYALERWDQGPKRSDIRKAQAHKRAIEIKSVRAQLGDFRDKRRRLFDQHRASQLETAKLTPYAGPNGTRWAIPWYVVDCESGGDWGAYNTSSGATGPYQMLPSTYSGVCRSCDWSEVDQHYSAGVVWQRSGGAEWACA